MRVNPMSDLATATRGLMTGGPVAEAALKSVLRAIGIVVVFAPLAVHVVAAQDLTGPVRRPGGPSGRAAGRPARASRPPVRRGSVACRGPRLALDLARHSC